MIGHSSARLSSWQIAAIACASLFALPAAATTVTDPTGDFIASFMGTKSGDIDATSAFATYDGTTFHIGGTVNGTVGTLASSLYVFGFNRGAGTSNFAAIGAPGVVFDAVITLTGAGVAGGRDLVSNTAIVLPAGAASISGNSFAIDVPASLLPSQGFTPLQYQVNLWPRDALAAGNAAIADFVPDNSDFVVSAAPVPEPWALSVFTVGLIGLAAAGVVGRRNRAT